MKNRGAIIIVNSLSEAVELMNEIAPEHLEIVTKEPMELLAYIKHAGAIFLGRYTPEAVGDYMAGPNHTLPTGGTAKFYSPLSVEHFLKKSSIISMSRKGLEEIGRECALIANIEGLHGCIKSLVTMETYRMGWLLKPPWFLLIRVIKNGFKWLLNKSIRHSFG